MGARGGGEDEEREDRREKIDREESGREGRGRG